MISSIKEIQSNFEMHYGYIVRVGINGLGSENAYI